MLVRWIGESPPLHTWEDCTSSWVQFTNQPVTAGVCALHYQLAGLGTVAFCTASALYIISEFIFCIQELEMIFESIISIILYFQWADWFTSTLRSLALRLVFCIFSLLFQFPIFLCYPSMVLYLSPRFSTTDHIIGITGWPHPPSNTTPSISCTSIILVPDCKAFALLDLPDMFPLRLCSLASDKQKSFAAHVIS